MSSSKRFLYAALVVAMTLSMVLPFVSSGASPANGITAPKEGATASGVVKVMGFAEDPNFLKWQLDVLPGGNADQAIFIALGTKPGEFTYDLDTTRFPDGEHALRLRVVRSDSNYDEYVTKFALANTAPAKPGAGSAPAAKTVSATPDIVDTAVASGQFGTLVAAVQAAGLVDALKGQGPFTVFAPDQKAFAAIPADTLNALLKDPKALSNILLFHVIPGKVMAADVKDGLSAKTLQGGNVTFKVVDGKVMINDANVVSTDIAAGNGVIHVIDKVILPPAAANANGITSPKEGAAVSGAAQIKGFAQDPNFLKWQLDLLPGGDSLQAISLAVGDKPGDFTYDLDTTGFPNGEHALRLRVVRTDSNYDEYFTKFTLKN